MFDVIPQSSLPWVLAAGIVIILGLAALVFVQKREIAKRTLSEARYREFIEDRDDLVCRSLADQTLLYVNDAYCDYFGKKSDELLGTRFTDHIAPSYRQQLIDQWKKFTPENPLNHIDQRVQLPGGEERWIRWLDRATFDDLGNLAEVFAVGRDITDLVQAREAEHASQEQLRQIIDLVPPMIFARDAEGRYSMANQATADLYGVSVDELVGSSLKDVHFNPEEVERFLSGDRAITESGERAFIAEQTIRDHRGESRVIQTTKIPFQMPGSAETAILGVSVDITDLKRAEAGFGEIVELAPDAVISVDDDYRIVLFNRGAEATFGYDSAEVIGQPVHMLLPESLQAGHGALMDGFARSPETSRPMNARGKVAGRRKDGTEFAAEASIGKLQQGGEASFIVLVRDVSERDLWEEQLRHAQKMEAVGQLTGGVAHDFNNLLTIILGNLQLLQRRIDDGPKTDHLFERAIVAAQRGGELTHRLLAFSRKTPLAPMATDLGPLIDDVVKLAARTIGENISVEFSPGDEVWLTNIDRAQLQSALMNLAINAGHAMPSGGELKFQASNVVIDRRQALTIGDMKPGDYVRIAVIDNGTGMTAETVERAFDPFFTTKEVGEGSGLGLSMVHGFVLQSGGQARILSEPGAGTTVELYFPKVSASDAADDDSVSDSEAGTGAVGSETVLVVEDDSDVRQIAVAHLTGRGYDVIEAEDGPAALQKLQDHKNIDVLFTDVMLPKGVSGTELASAALRLRPELKILFASGNAKIDVARDFGANGDFVFLSKPYLGGDLAASLRNLLEN